MIGSISSPNYETEESNSKYSNNLECEWLIESIPGTVVSIEFDGRFEIEATPNCTNDFVEVVSGIVKLFSANFFLSYLVLYSTQVLTANITQTRRFLKK